MPQTYSLHNPEPIRNILTKREYTTIINIKTEPRMWSLLTSKIVFLTHISKKSKNFFYHCNSRFITDYISVTHNIISDIITFAITNLHDEMEKSNFLPPTNSYILHQCPQFFQQRIRWCHSLVPPSV